MYLHFVRQNVYTPSPQTASWCFCGLLAEGTVPEASNRRLPWTANTFCSVWMLLFFFHDDHSYVKWRRLNPWCGDGTVLTCDAGVSHWKFRTAHTAGMDSTVTWHWTGIRQSGQTIWKNLRNGSSDHRWQLRLFNGSLKFFKTMCRWCSSVQDSKMSL